MTVPAVRALSSVPTPMVPSSARPGHVMAPQLFAQIRAAGAPTTIVALPAVVNVELVEGDDFAMALVVADQNGTPVDLAGTMQAEVRVKSEDPLLGSWLTSVVENSVTLYLSHDVTVGLPLTCQWDLKWTATSGWISTLAGGALTVQRRITEVP